jgi:tetratricopeptide (TPR) repeat protein
MQQFQQALSQYLALRQQAAQDANNPAAWQAAVHAGEALLGQEFAELEQVNWTELRAELANDYTSLCIAHEEQHALEASLAATERAIELAPENAMWRRNRTGTLIDLGRLDEAAAELERARALEPEAARLAELEQQLHPEG